MKNIILFTLLLVSGVAISSDLKEIRFGVDPSFYPYESKDKSGNLVGFDIDLGNAICRKLQTRCVWVESSFDSIIPALQAKKFDAILSSMFVTEQRAKQISFTDKIYNGAIFMVAHKNTSIAPNIESLKGKTIGVEQGSTQEMYANKKWRNTGINIVSYQGNDLLIQDLESGRLDAALMDGVAAEYGLLKNPQGKDFSFVGSALKDKDLFGQGVAIGLRKDDTQLRKEINDAISQIISDGTYKKLSSKYFSFDIYSES